MNSKINEAFLRWLKRYGRRPWEDELEKAYAAGYRQAIKDNIDV